MKNVIELNRCWTFSAEAKEGEKKTPDSVVSLPFFHSLSTMPCGIFSIDWTALEEHHGKTVYLQISQISGEAEISCNGKTLGTHSSGNCAFTRQLTIDAQMGTTYNIEVRVTPGARKDGLFAFGTASLIIVDSSHFNKTDFGCGVTVIPENKNTGAEITVKTAIIRPNNYDIVSYTVYGMKGEVIASKTCKPTAPDTVIEIPHHELWDGQSGAYVYTFEAKLLRDSMCLDEVTTVFGIKETELGTDGFLYLNGFKLPLNGVVLTDCSQVRTDMENIRRLDGNLLLSPILPTKTNLLSVCDKAGMLFWYCLPFSGNTEADKEHLREFIALYRNHPSLTAVVFAKDGGNGYFDEMSDCLSSLAPELTAIAERYIDAEDDTISEKAKAVLLRIPCWSAPESFITFNGRFSYLQEKYPEKCFAVLPESPDKADKTPEELGEWLIRMWNTFCRQKIIAYVGGLLTDGKEVNSKRGLISSTRGQIYDIFWYYKSQFSVKSFIKICELENYETFDKFIDIKCITNSNKIRLLVNGKDKKYKPEKITDGVYVFRQLKLKKDVNLIEVSADDECDSVEIIRI